MDDNRSISWYQSFGLGPFHQPGSVLGKQFHNNRGFRIENTKSYFLWAGKGVQNNIQNQYLFYVCEYKYQKILISLLHRSHQNELNTE